MVTLAGAALFVAAAPRAEAQAPLRALAPVLESLRRTNDWTLAQQAEICEIAAPPFGEAARARSFRDRLRLAGLADVRIDTAGNVIARRPGGGSGPTLVLSAHLDTVFPESTDVRVRRTGTRFEGPGIADDCRGLAILRGVRNLFHEMQGGIDAFITVDANGYAIARDAVGSRRYRVAVRDPGGHSWTDFGRPSAVHALGLRTGVFQ